MFCFSFLTYIKCWKPWVSLCHFLMCLESSCLCPCPQLLSSSFPISFGSFFSSNFKSLKKEESTYEKIHDTWLSLAYHFLCFVASKDAPIHLPCICTGKSLQVCHTDAVFLTAFQNSWKTIRISSRSSDSQSYWVRCSVCECYSWVPYKNIKLVFISFKYLLCQMFIRLEYILRISILFWTPRKTFAGTLNS